MRPLGVDLHLDRVWSERRSWWRSSHACSWSAVSWEDMPSEMVAGGGLAGLSAAAALGTAGYTVLLFEARPYPGGRATSYASPTGDGSSETIDNCQHVLLR